MVVANTWLAGLEPLTGKTLWKHPIASGNMQEESAHATPAGGSRLAGRPPRATSVGLEVVKNGAALRPRELYRTHGASPAPSRCRSTTTECSTASPAASSPRSTPPPARSCGARGRRAAAASPWSTASWRWSMPEGNLVLAAAHRADYRELARVKALTDGNFASRPPSPAAPFSCVTSSEIAAVRPAQDRQRAGGRQGGGPARRSCAASSAAVLAKVKAAPAGEKQRLVDAYFANVKSLPILEPGLVHFAYRGQAEDVGGRRQLPARQACRTARSSTWRAPTSSSAARSSTTMASGATRLVGRLSAIPCPIRKNPATIADLFGDQLGAAHAGAPGPVPI